MSTLAEAVGLGVTGLQDSAISQPKVAACLGMSFWKRRRIAEFLGEGRTEPAFVRSTAVAVRLALSRGGSIAVWGSREPADLAAAAREAGVPVVRVEDGFLRSVGLGADFLPGASVVVDRRGIYYNPERPSDLEVLLNEAAFDACLLERARALIDRIVASGFTKYNIGSALPPLAGAEGRQRIFVPGQVEDDRSVMLGGADVKTNLGLLETVRRANPEAFILYKPHPDVDAGHRQGAIADSDARRFADQVVRGVSSAALIAGTDAVHTITSLAGFEALLRNRPVTVYGRPFYAGWGLTQDRVPQLRRRRQVSLEQLVAAALILYPRYVDPVSGRACTPEQLLDRFAEPAAWRAGPLVQLRRLQGRLMRPLRAAAPRA